MASKGMPLYIYDEPLHAVILMAFGACFFGIASAFVYVAKNRGIIPDDPPNDVRFHLFRVLFLNWARTVSKTMQRGPVKAYFWPMHTGFGRIFQLIGAFIFLNGTVGLVVSIAKKFM